MTTITNNATNFGTGLVGQVLTSTGAGSAPTFQTLMAGTVSSVNGTALQIDVANPTTTPVISIDSGYLGQGSITTVGALSSGSLASGFTVVTPALGGTGVANTGTFTVGGNTSFIGASTFAGTLTGNTAVTFPTSGTLSTTTGTVTSVGLTGSTGLVIGNSPITSSGTMTATLGTELQGLSGLSANGVVARTGAGTYASRTITGTAADIAVTNGSGASGNPTIDLINTAVTPGSYTYSSLTVDANGRLTAASSGSNPLTSVSITGDTGGALTGGSFTFAGGTTGLSFGGSGSTETLTFAGITANGGVVTLGADSAANAINIGTVSNTGRNLTLGNTTGTSSITEYVGTGNYLLDGVGASTYAFGPSTTTGTMTFGGTVQTGDITIGSSSGTSTISLGAGVGQTTVNIANNATTGAINMAAAATTATISIGGAAQTGLITVGSSTGTNTIAIGSGIGAGTINIGAGAIGVKTIAIGTGAAANIVTVGTTNGAASTTINAGSGGVLTAGIAGVTSLSANVVVGLNTSTGQLSQTTLTAGTNITLTPAAGTITIASSGGGTVTNVTSSTQAMANNGVYICNNGASLITFTLPATAAIGDVYQIIGNSVGGWTVTENSGQIMKIGPASTTVTTGSISSFDNHDTVTIRCVTANTTFVVYGIQGNITYV